jgi:hypothetical protein
MLSLFYTPFNTYYNRTKINSILVAKNKSIDYRFEPSQKTIKNDSN